MTNEMPNKPWWRSPAWWAVLMAGPALVFSGFDVWWTHIRVSEHLRLTPIAAHLDVIEDGEQSVLAVEFALANNGTTPAILAELCALPRPWGDTFGDPTDYSPKAGEDFRVIPSVTGVPWRAEPTGHQHTPIWLGPGALLSDRAYFNLAPYTHNEWFTGLNYEVDIELYATVLDHKGAIHITKLAERFAISGPTTFHPSHSEPSEPLPGTVSPRAGSFSDISSGTYCSFIGPVFKPMETAVR